MRDEKFLALQAAMPRYRFSECAPVPPIRRMSARIFWQAHQERQGHTPLLYRKESAQASQNPPQMNRKNKLLDNSRVIMICGLPRKSGHQQPIPVRIINPLIQLPPAPTKLQSVIFDAKWTEVAPIIFSWHHAITEIRFTLNKILTIITNIGWVTEIKRINISTCQICARSAVNFTGVVFHHYLSFLAAPAWLMACSVRSAIDTHCDLSCPNSTRHHILKSELAMDAQSVERWSSLARQYARSSRCDSIRQVLAATIQVVATPFIISVPTPRVP